MNYEYPDQDARDPEAKGRDSRLGDFRAREGRDYDPLGYDPQTSAPRPYEPRNLSDRDYRDRAYWEQLEHLRREREYLERLAADRPRPKREGRNVIATIFGNLVWMTTGGVLLAGAVWGLHAWYSGGNLLNTLISSLNPPPEPPRVDVRSVVVTQIRDASELTTAVYTMEAVVPTSQDMKIGNLVVGTTKLLYIAHGEVRAGVDLSQISPQNIEVLPDSTIRLYLPPPRILDSKIDVNNSSVYDYDRGFLSMGPDTAPDLQSLAQKQALLKITSSACTNKLFQQANDRAKLVVTQLLNVAGHKQVVVETQPPAPETCATAAPAPVVAPAPPTVAPAPVASPAMPPPPSLPPVAVPLKPPTSYRGP